MKTSLVLSAAFAALVSADAWADTYYACTVYGPDTWAHIPATKEACGNYHGEVAPADSCGVPLYYEETQKYAEAGHTQVPICTWQSGAAPDMYKHFADYAEKKGGNWSMACYNFRDTCLNDGSDTWLDEKSKCKCFPPIEDNPKTKAQIPDWDFSCAIYDKDNNIQNQLTKKTCDSYKKTNPVNAKSGKCVLPEYTDEGNLDENDKDKFCYFGYWAASDMEDILLDAANKKNLIVGCAVIDYTTSCLEFSAKKPGRNCTCASEPKKTPNKRWLRELVSAEMNEKRALPSSLVEKHVYANLQKNRRS